MRGLGSVLQTPLDVALAYELDGEDDVQMANLTSAQTGVAGTILISAALERLRG